MKSPERRMSIALSELAIATLAITACQNTAEIPAEDEKVSIVSSVVATPDFSRLSNDGITCEGGAPRPCSQILYGSPALVRPLVEGAYLNFVPDPAAPFWPHEAFGTQVGDAVTIVCQVEGESVSTADGHTSTRWDVLEVTPDHLNASAVSEVQSGTADFGVALNDDGSLKSVYAYAADLWLGDTYRPELTPCTDTQNPGGYQPAVA